MLFFTKVSSSYGIKKQLTLGKELFSLGLKARSV